MTRAPLVYSFPPVCDQRAKVLILGSMPGVASLDAGQYYAHPRNAFWPILGSLLQFDPSATYEARLAAVQGAGIAIWDVLKACRRAGSADASIDPQNCQVNDFVGFFAEFPGIHHVYFNGNAAEQYFRRLAPVTGVLEGRVCTRLPSTSPAYAQLSLVKKLEAWSIVVSGSSDSRK